MNLLVAQIVQAGKKHKYKLKKNSDETEWENTWTAGNAILFTMSSLTLIGYFVFWLTLRIKALHSKNTFLHNSKSEHYSKNMHF